MALTPDDVRNRRFTTVRLKEGYDVDEVDAFLDEVEAELTRLGRESDDLRARAAVAAQAPAPPPSPTENAVRMLEMAQRTADEHMAQAKADADALLAQAQSQATEMQARTRSEHAEAQRQIDELKAFEREYRSRLRTYLEGQLRDLQGTGVDAPAPSAPPPAAAMTTTPSAPREPVAADPASRPFAPPVAPPAPADPPSGPPAQPVG